MFCLKREAPGGRPAFRDQTKINTYAGSLAPRATESTGAKVAALDTAGDRSLSSDRSCEGARL
jgi:hypothetical protein